MTRNQFDQKCDVARDIGSAKMTADIELTYWAENRSLVYASMMVSIGRP